MLLYLLAIVFPPLGILVQGKIIQAAINGLIWGYALMEPGFLGLVLWFCAASHASYVINHARRSRFSSRDFTL